MPILPKLPNPEDALNFIDKAGDAVSKGLELIDRTTKKIDRLAGRIDSVGSPTLETGASEKESTTAVKTGTACLPCCRDHLSTTSSALSEAVRFARDKGVRDPEALRRIRIALDEMNIMERIDLAPDEVARLRGQEKELAQWTLIQSKNLRHAITDVRNVEALEQAAARASQATEDFMQKMWAIPEEKCETCAEVRESLKQFIKTKGSSAG